MKKIQEKGLRILFFGQILFLDCPLKWFLMGPPNHTHLTWVLCIMQVLVRHVAIACSCIRCNIFETDAVLEYAFMHNQELCIYIINRRCIIRHHQFKPKICSRNLSSFILECLQLTLCKKIKIKTHPTSFTVCVVRQLNFSERWRARLNCELMWGTPTLGQVPKNTFPHNKMVVGSLSGWSRVE